MLGKAHTKAPEPSLMESFETGEGEDKTYLLFTTGSLTYSPHQIGNLDIFPRQVSFTVPEVSSFLFIYFYVYILGIKRIKPDQMTTSGPVLGEERNSEFFDSLDHVIDIHGHIIGMGLSPDHRWDNGT